jgi:hypothetical protein
VATETTVTGNGADQAHETEIVEGGALGALNRAEIDVQITTAKRYPRSIVAFRRQALEMATLDEETAGSMFYTLPRSGKTIEGPSVRLAEVVGSAWGNLRYGARVLELGEKFLTAQGACFDLEKNIAIQVEVRRRITDKQGRRYNDDMLTVTANAACSIALRQAIFKVVPFAYVKGVYDEAKLVSIGKTLTMEQRRTRALEWFSKVGATEPKVLALLGRKGIEDITVEDLVSLQGLKTAIKDGDTTVDDAFREVSTPQAAGPAPATPDPLVAKAQAAATAPDPLVAKAQDSTPASAPRDCPHLKIPPSRIEALPLGKSLVCPDCGQELTREREPGEDADDVPPAKGQRRLGE